jgi:hypothetical protein
MSRYYEFDIAIEAYRPAREAAIKTAVEALDFGPNATEPYDWEDWTESLHITGRRSLCGGQSEGEFTDKIAAAVWKANRGPCTIEVRATDLDNIPYGMYTRDADDYRAWLEDRARKAKSKKRKPKKGRRTCRTSTP